MNRLDPTNRGLKKYERPGLTDDEIEEIKEAFDLFDTEHTGKIDVKELRAAMESLGFTNQHKVVQQMFEDVDREGTSMLDFESFLNLMTAKMVFLIEINIVRQRVKE